MKRLLAAVLSSLVVTACGAEMAAPPPTKEPETDPCQRGVLEPDFQAASALQGPGVDANGQLSPGSYIISSTYLRMRSTVEAQTEFDAAVVDLNETLATQPGLLAIQFGGSESCNTKRTLTVWKDEASMYQFVASPPHRRAMLKVGVMSRGGGIVTSWAGDERGATWSEAIEHLARETRPTY
ncbi:antibiotic biosynthesis monooxygenase [Cystobacter ferrugineus]|uniref:ABM domain-containing protein n=1 Tax=Cystobacter ferrugineus TaxID=83449 RepID=A0A1L9B6Q3_9BACT|nr:antibiotic biosynthesis monooxygenase [Cystobacter ferrugineus]OJH37926.1 hypothetical protein BON30_27600 [Cystobacter ferrugineus]